MRGSFENPPIVVEVPRARPAILLVGALLFAAAGVAIAAGPEKVGGLLQALVFGAGAGLALWAVLRPTRLEIAPSGLVEREPWWTHRMAWSEAADFRPAMLGLAMPAVGFDYLAEPRRRWGVHRLNGAISGVQGALQPGYELKPHELADLLNQARERWLSGLEMADGVPAAAAPPSPVMTGFAGARMGRKVFWLGWGALAVATTALSFAPALGEAAWTFAFVFGVGLYAARLHDLGRSGWWQAALYAIQASVIFAPEGLGLANARVDFGMALLVQIVFTIAIGTPRGEAAANRFGPTPGHPTALGLAEVFR